jgi:peptidoglycan/LPS O-acetylase OafA/YrhL
VIQAERLSSRHIYALDGLRAIAVLSVLGLHYSAALKDAHEWWARGTFSVFSHGAKGVDLFFALSGFLITGILIDSRTGAGYFRSFWARRVLRIFPVYFAYLAVILIAVRAARPDEFAGVQLWPYFVFASNWKHGTGSHDPYLIHLWSLAIEEQFYLFWPFLVWWCPPRRLLAACGLVVFLALAARVAAVGMVSEATLFRVTPFRADTLACGAAIAVIVRNQQLLSIALKSSPVALAASLLTWFFTLHTTAYFTIGFTALAVAIAVIVLWTVNSQPAVLCLPGLRSIGRVSYGMYMYHLLVGVLCWRLIAFTNTGVMRPGQVLFFMLLATVATFLIAQLSYRLMEQLILRYKSRFSVNQ